MNHPEHDQSHAHDCESVCRCCAALAVARAQSLFDPHPGWHSPLTPGVQRINLSHSEDGREIWAVLGTDWPRMFVQLPAIGAAQAVTFGAGAILSRRLRRVHFAPAKNGVECVGDHGRLHLNFERFAFAQAVHLRRAAGHSFGVEFMDSDGETMHALMLTHASDFDAFFAWVRLHQACDSDPDLPFAEAAPSGVESPVPAWLPCSRQDFTAALEASIASAARFRASVANAAVIQVLDLVPTHFIQDRGWTTICDGSNCLHLRHDFLVRRDEDSQGQQTSPTEATLGIVGQDGRPSFLLQPASSDTARAHQTLGRSPVD
ncbi:MAG: hypothetical protein INR62_03645 [Rhodospirillales bacterium]|nr:hypothetical protein [Acetobacter sp.]